MPEQLGKNDQSLLITRAYRIAIEDINKGNWPKVALDIVFEFMAVGLLPAEAVIAFGRIAKKAYSRNIKPPSP